MHGWVFEKIIKLKNNIFTIFGKIAEIDNSNYFACRISTYSARNDNINGKKRGKKNKVINK